MNGYAGSFVIGFKADAYMELWLPKKPSFLKRLWFRLRLGLVWEDSK